MAVTAKRIRAKQEGATAQRTCVARKLWAPAILVLLVICALFGVHMWSDGQLALVAQVHDGDGRVHELDLSQDKTFRVETSYGVNVVVVRNGGVHIEGADCPNHDCMNQGSIDRVGEQIICLPHHLWIEIVSLSDEGDDLDNGQGSTDGQYDTVGR